MISVVDRPPPEPHATYQLAPLSRALPVIINDMHHFDASDKICTHAHCEVVNLVESDTCKVV